MTLLNDSWMEAGLCQQTDPEAFFPEKGGSTDAAKRVCMVCPVRIECREYALQTDQRHGVWGGLSERERRKENKRRKQLPTCQRCELSFDGDPDSRYCPPCRTAAREESQQRYEQRRRHAHPTAA